MRIHPTSVRNSYCERAQQNLHGRNRCCYLGSNDTFGQASIATDIVWLISHDNGRCKSPEPSFHQELNTPVMGNCLGKTTSAIATTDSFVDVLFFPDPAMPCKNFHSGEGCTRKNCKKIHDQGSSLLTMLGYLKGAKKTMDICVFTITCDEIADAVLEAFNRGVKIRIITDDGQAKGQGSDIQKFIDAGIPVRDDNARTYMHHKFCVIDKTILLNGSFNWSRQAVVGNNENLVIHKNGPIVDRFDKHFDQLWKKFER